MGTEDLHMMQVSDSMFPTGLFAASGGIETMFAQKKITDAAGLRGFLGAMITNQVGPYECVMLACAHRGPGRANIAEADSICNAMRSNKEAREASCRAGGQLARCVSGFVDDGTLTWYCSELGSGVSGEYPVSLGVCCRAMGVGEQRAASMLLYGYVAVGVGAALRLGMIDHLEGQQVIHSLKPLISGAASGCAGMPASDAWQFAPQAEIYQMAHEGADSKMFIT